MSEMANQRPRLFEKLVAMRDRYGSRSYQDSAPTKQQVVGGRIKRVPMWTISDILAEINEAFKDDDDEGAIPTA